MEDTVVSPTFCVDIRVGYSNVDRDALIRFLQKNKANLALTNAKRGKCGSMKILRVYTTQGERFISFIEENYFSGDECSFEIHSTQKLANESKTFSPERDSHGISNNFSL
ncbi:MAG: hypothetical protein WCG73_01165 [Candidatus Moraniibacteriota bacterium]